MVQIKVPVKACKNCGHVFVVGKHGSLGIMFWLTILTGIGGIIYWYIRRKERCPACGRTDFNVTVEREIEA